MKSIFRLLICLAASFVVVYLSGYGNTVLDISESLAITTFLGGVVVLTVVCFLIWNTYSNLKREIRRLRSRVDWLEDRIRRQNDHE